MAVTRRELNVLVPVLLVDEVLPRLKDTELRILLIVLRQTRVQGSESGSAWLTHRELCRRTGRASEAVSVAVDALVKHGALQVGDEVGSCLMTPYQRQARTGKRFYQVSLRGAAPEHSKASTLGKAKTIEVNNNLYSFRKTEDTQRHEGGAGLPTEQQTIDLEKARIRDRLRRIAVQNPVKGT